MNNNLIQYDVNYILNKRNEYKKLPENEEHTYTELFNIIKQSDNYANIQKINLNIKELFLFILSQFIVFGIYPFYYIIFWSLYCY